MEVTDDKVEDSDALPDWFIGMIEPSDDVADFLDARRKELAQVALASPSTWLSD